MNTYRKFYPATLVAFLMLCSIQAYAQCWTYMPPPHTNTSFIEGSFSDSLHGVIIEQNAVIHSTVDGGMNWRSRELTIDHPQTAIMLDSSLGFVVANYYIYKTTNSGDSWRGLLLPPPYNTHTDIAFSTKLKGIIVGEYGNVFRTTNGGANWQLRSTTTLNHLFAISFFDSSNAVAVGVNAVIRTTNSGLTWSTLTAPLKTYTGVSFVNINQGAIISNDGYVYRTTNAGISWIEQRVHQSSPLFDIRFTDASHGIISGGNVILSTTDGGNTWRTIPTSVLNNNIAYMTPATSIIVGNQNILTTSSSPLCGAPPQPLSPLNSALVVNTYIAGESPFIPLSWDLFHAVNLSKTHLQVSRDSTFGTKLMDTTIQVTASSKGNSFRLKSAEPGMTYFWRAGLEYFENSEIYWSQRWRFITGNCALTGTVFDDDNRDSVQSSNEAGIIRARVILSGKHQGELFTDSSGKFMFTGLDSGLYQIKCLPLSPWRSSSRNTLNDLRLTWNQSITDLAFGQYYPWNVVSGLVYTDENDNIIQDGAERGTGGICLRLVSPSQTVITYTDSTGSYRLKTSETFACSVYVLPPENWEMVHPRLVEGYFIPINGFNKEIPNVQFAIHPIPERTKIPMMYHDISYNRMTTIRWGVRQGASSGIWNTDTTSTTIDFSEGEEELPMPYLDTYDVRFIRPPGSRAYFGNGSWIDIRPYFSTTQVDTYKISFATGELTNGDYPVTFLWPKQLIQSSYNGPVIIKMPDGQSFNLKSLDSLVISDREIQSLLIIASQPNLEEIQWLIRAGWALVSVPYTVSDGSIATLFPTSLSRAFGFHFFTGYTVHTVLEPGPGYWLKFLSPIMHLPFSGTERQTDTIPVIQGWNLIGALSSSIDTSSIRSNPPGIVNGPYFSYDSRGYVPSRTIDPAHGYWVKISQNGSLILNQGTARQTIALNQSVDYEHYSRLQFTDAYGYSQSLTIVQIPDNSVNNSFFELPPKPPQGIFDIRFHSNRQIEVNTGEHNQVFPISISSAQYPVTIRLEQRSMAKGILHSSGSALLFNQEGVAILYEEPEGLSFHTNSKEVTPSSFTLEQNYPNPFNPLTNFTFQVAGRGTITLTVYSVLGEEIATLLHRELDPGTYTIPWDATGKPSGIYWCRLTANNNKGETYASVKKILLVK